MLRSLDRLCFIAPLFALATLFAGILADEAAAADRSSLATVHSGSEPVTVPTVDPRLETCIRIDPRTGAFAPCPEKTSTGSGSGGGLAAPGSPLPPAPEPVDFFDADYDIADFDADPDGVMPNAYFLGQLSGMAYLGFDDAREATQEMGFEQDPALLFGIEAGVGDSKAYVVYDDDFVIVSFEGSTGGPTGTDWMQNNLQFDPVFKPEWGKKSTTICAFGYCKTIDVRSVGMHRGFLNAADVIFDEVLEEIEPLLASGQRRLWLTGHSLGGAVAQITAFRLEFEESIPVQGVHVFGAPAVGDVLWQEVFENEVTPNVHRWGIQYDPMPMVTAEPLFFHIGIMNNLYYDGDLLLDGGEGDALGGVPLCGPLYNANYTHMLYWQRMHEEMLEFDDDHGILLEDAMPTPSEPGCWADF
ncbi:MAG: lipase family protein [bacterium]|nr:lipase family protein [bacterium]